MTQGFAPAQPVKGPVPQPAASVTQVIEQFQSYFSDVKDPRVERTRAHLLSDILIISILAVIGGAQGWEGIALYGISKQEWLSQFLALPNGIPCADTFRRVFERIDPKQFEQSFRRWVAGLVEFCGAQVIPIDGKTLRGSYERQSEKNPLHLVSAWASESRLVLGQVKVSDKSNEITAIPVLLELLTLEGTIVTLDAMGTQTAIAAQIYEAQADYILSLKANHPTLYVQVEEWFEQAAAQEFAGLPVSVEQRVEKGHHRIEKRFIYCVPVSAMPPLHGQDNWAGLKSIVRVVRERQLWNKTTHEVQFYLTSLPCDAHYIGRAIRQHWGIENQVHWTLDVTFGEDASRIRRGHGPQNFALLRRFALNSLNREQSFRRSTRQKSQRAAMDNNYMFKVLAASLTDIIDDTEPSCQ